MESAAAESHAMSRKLLSVGGIVLCLGLGWPAVHAQSASPVWPWPEDAVLLRLELGTGAWGNWRVTSIGDVDLDGHADLALATVERDDGDRMHARVDVVSGRDGSRVRSIVLPNSEGFPMCLSIATLSDVTDDGQRDFVVGLGMLSDAGHIYLVSTGEGHIVREWIGDNLRDFFGQCVADAGDLDHDGFPDIVSPSGAGDDADEGLLAWLGFPERADLRAMSGRSGTILWKTNAPDDEGQRWGSSVAAVGDMDGDATPDVIVGRTPARVWHGRPTPPGDAWIVSGRTGELLRRIEGTSDADHFGSAAAGPLTDAGGTSSAFLVGSDGTCPRDELAHPGYVRCIDTRSGETKYELHGVHAGDQFSHALVILPDWDGDCCADWAATAPQDSGAGLPGYVRVHSGRDGHLLAYASSEFPGDEFGWAVGDAGDVDCDGHPDLAVIARRGAAGGDQAGWVLSGRVLMQRTIIGECADMSLLAPIQR